MRTPSIGKLLFLKPRATPSATQAQQVSVSAPVIQRVRNMTTSTRIIRKTGS